MNMFTLNDLQNKVEKGISDYIEFDIKQLFKVSDYITIYGGSVRDSIAGLEIHDIDILCMPQSANKLFHYLTTECGYSKIDLYRQDTINMYKGITLIAEPWTLMNDNKKIVQIIRPRWDGPGMKTSPVTEYKRAYYNLIKNVDISCCGVFLENLDGDVKLREACRNAIVNCMTKTFKVNKESLLFNEYRTSMRTAKLESRGWEDIETENMLPNWLNSNSDKNYKLRRERTMKLCALNFKPEYDYKIWTEDDYIKKTSVDDLSLDLDLFGL